MVTDVIDDLLKEGRHYDHAIVIGPMIMMKLLLKNAEKTIFQIL